MADETQTIPSAAHSTPPGAARSAPITDAQRKDLEDTEARLREARDKDDADAFAAVLQSDGLLRDTSLACELLFAAVGKRMRIVDYLLHNPNPHGRIFNASTAASNAIVNAALNGSWGAVRAILDAGYTKLESAGCVKMVVSSARGSGQMDVVLRVMRANPPAKRTRMFSRPTGLHFE